MSNKRTKQDDFNEVTSAMFNKINMRLDGIENAVNSIRRIPEIHRMQRDYEKQEQACEAKNKLREIMDQLTIILEDIPVVFKDESVIRVFGTFFKRAFLSEKSVYSDKNGNLVFGVNPEGAK